jgi:hypothetical protein
MFCNPTTARAAAAALGCAAVALISSPAAAATKTYVYEWMHLRPVFQPDGPFTRGALFLEDIHQTSPVDNSAPGSIPGTNGRSVLKGHIEHDGQVIMQSSARGPEAGFPQPTDGDYDIIQIGPFAQQAKGDISNNGFDGFVSEQCTEQHPDLELPLARAHGGARLQPHRDRPPRHSDGGRRLSRDHLHPQGPP